MKFSYVADFNVINGYHVRYKQPFYFYKVSIEENSKRLLVGNVGAKINHKIFQFAT